MANDAGKKNLTQSVLDRLKNKAQAQGENVQFLQERYVAERFLYRLSVSPYAQKLILKGGTMFLVWFGKSHRATRDVDFSGHMSNDTEAIKRVFQDICSVTLPEEGDDAVVFDTASMRLHEIKETDEYHGVRVIIPASIGNVRLKFQADIGFGDVVVPDYENVDYPRLLDTLPAPHLRVYSTYSLIAEKFEAIVKLGVTNSRYKDFYDIWTLSRVRDIDGDLLRQAIAKTFARRGTPIPEALPSAFTPEFYDDEATQKQWAIWVTKERKSGYTLPASIADTVTDLIAFLMPVVDVIRSDEEFKRVWHYASAEWAVPLQETTSDNAS
jgi:predicted nucleotidyltransferase component of viral defense system